MSLEYRVNSKLSFDSACSKVPEIVSKNGFAVLAEIKTSEILKSKGFDYEDMRTYDICSTGYASRALSMDSTVETIMPCHLVVKRRGNQAEVAVQLPGEMFRSLHKERSEKAEMFLGEVESKLKEIVDSFNMGK